MLYERDRRNAIDVALARMDTRRISPWSRIPVFSSGCVSIDDALGVGGFPRGGVVEIYGPESSGKTTIALQAIAQAQQAGCIAAFVDAEHAFDPNYARNLGVDISSLLVSQPDHGEQALEIVAALLGSGAVAIIVVDSVAALVPKIELAGEMGDVHVGMHARLMSQALRKLTGLAAKTSTCLMFTNQVREQLGVVCGDPETTTGGRALKLYASIRLAIQSTGFIEESGVITGNRTKVKIVKNKCAPPFSEAQFDIYYGLGTSRERVTVLSASPVPTRHA